MSGHLEEIFSRKPQELKEINTAISKSLKQSMMKRPTLRMRKKLEFAEFKLMSSIQKQNVIL